MRANCTGSVVTHTHSAHDLQRQIYRVAYRICFDINSYVLCFFFVYLISRPNRKKRNRKELITDTSRRRRHRRHRRRHRRRWPNRVKRCGGRRIHILVRIWQTATKQ